MSRLLDFCANWRCWLRHEWEYHMETLTPTTHYEHNKPFVLGWKQCNRCGHSKITMVAR